MEELRRRLVPLGFERIATVKASGNVVFESTIGGSPAIRSRIEAVLRKMTGGEVLVFLRSWPELRKVVAASPFAGRTFDGGTRYVSFLRSEPSRTFQLPVSSPFGETTIVGVHGLEVYSLGRHVGNRAGFPNPFVEKWAGGPATTRAWTTVTENAALPDLGTE